jgi:hypothetical protein
VPRVSAPSRPGRWVQHVVEAQRAVDKGRPSFEALWREPREHVRGDAGG